MRLLIADTTWATMAAARDLEGAGFLITRANDGGELFEYADLGEQNLILLDSDLPDMPAMDCLRSLRRRAPRTGICMIVPEGDTAARLSAFARGADDVFTPRTPAGEMVARVQAVARRRAGLARPVVEAGMIRIDVAARRVEVAGRPLHLTRTEYELVEMLALRAGQVVDRAAIMAQLYALDEAPDAKILGVYVCHIRAKIAELGGDPGQIANLRGRGYALVGADGGRRAA